MGNSPTREQDKEKEPGRNGEMAREKKESQCLARQKVKEERASKWRSRSNLSGVAKGLGKIRTIEKVSDKLMGKLPGLFLGLALYTAPVHLN